MAKATKAERGLDDADSRAVAASGEGTGSGAIAGPPASGAEAAAADSPAATKDRTGSAPATHGTTVSVPLPTFSFAVRRVQFPVPATLRGGGRPAGQVIGAAGGAVSRFPRKELVLFAGLGAAAAFSVIEWPVAVAVAVGSEVARRAARTGARQAAPADQPAKAAEGPAKAAEGPAKTAEGSAKTTEGSV